MAGPAAPLGRCSLLRLCPGIEEVALQFLPRRLPCSPQRLLRLVIINILTFLVAHTSTVLPALLRFRRRFGLEVILERGEPWARPLAGQGPEAAPSARFVGGLVLRARVRPPLIFNLIYANLLKALYFRKLFLEE